MTGVKWDEKWHFYIRTHHGHSEPMAHVNTAKVVLTTEKRETQRDYHDTMLLHATKWDTAQEILRSGKLMPGGPLRLRNEVHFAVNDAASLSTKKEAPPPKRYPVGSEVLE